MATCPSLWTQTLFRRRRLTFKAQKPPGSWQPNWVRWSGGSLSSRTGKQIKDLTPLAVTQEPEPALCSPFGPSYFCEWGSSCRGNNKTQKGPDDARMSASLCCGRSDKDPQSASLKYPIKSGAHICFYAPPSGPVKSKPHIVPDLDVEWMDETLQSQFSEKSASVCVCFCVSARICWAHVGTKAVKLLRMGKHQWLLVGSVQPRRTIMIMMMMMMRRNAHTHLVASTARFLQPRPPLVVELDGHATAAWRLLAKPAKELLELPPQGGVLLAGPGVTRAPPQPLWGEEEEGEEEEKEALSNAIYTYLVLQ